jgi:hypothetical protein
MKADESADCAGSCGSCVRTELFFFFLWVLEIVKLILKLEFLLGPDLVILSSSTTIPNRIFGAATPPPSASRHPILFPSGGVVACVVATRLLRLGFLSCITLETRESKG